MRALAPFSSGKTPQWLLAFDFDGTLVDHDTQPSISLDLFELIKELRETHHAYWVVNTGRSLMHTVQGITQAKFPFLPDFLIVREREIYRPNEFGRWVSDGGWNKSCDKAHRKLFRKQRRLLSGIRKWVESETTAVWGIQEGEPDGIVASTADEMEKIVALIDDKIGGVPHLSYQRNGIYLRFSHSDYHKGTAMRELARQLGMGPEQSFAIGDSHNDLDMLDVAMACHIACPANAANVVKQQVSARGGYVAQGRASLGVIESLHALFSKENEGENTGGGNRTRTPEGT